MCQRHIGSITTMRNENAPDPRGIVPRIEGMPPAAEIDLDPRSKIHGCIRRRKADIRDVTGAVARRNVQATTESNCQMCEVAANSAALAICFERGSGGPRMLVAECDMVVHEVADGLNARPPERCMPEEAPCLVG